jgi:hypothetical protein
MRAASTQSLAGLALNKKAAAMMAKAQTSDQKMGEVASFLELGFTVNMLAGFVGQAQTNGTGSLSD